MSIAVFGRGKSIVKWRDYPIRPIFEKLYFVNNCTEEIMRLGVERGDAGTFYHVAGRKGATVMSGLTYGKLDIAHAYVNAIDLPSIHNRKRWEQCGYSMLLSERPPELQKRGYRTSDWKGHLKGRPKGHMGLNGHCWPTTGLFAIDLALILNNPDEIWLYGFDFYQQPYFVKKNRPYQTQKSPKVRMMYVYLDRLVQEFHDTQFVCTSEVEIAHPNWKNI